MNRLLLASMGSGVLGGLAGAALMLLVTQKEATIAAEDTAAVRADLERRLGGVERALGDMQRSTERVQRLAEQAIPRVRVLPALSTTDDPPLPADDDEPLRLDSPVFEAAVLDLIERADDARHEMRAAARDDRRRQREQYWADELTMRLGLTPAQSERLLAIQAQLAKDLERVRGESDDGRHVPREQRRLARDTARQQADEQLRAVLTRQQVAAYEALDDELKLYRPRDPD